LVNLFNHRCVMDRIYRWSAVFPDSPEIGDLSATLGGVVNYHRFYIEALGDKAGHEGRLYSTAFQNSLLGKGLGGDSVGVIAEHARCNGVFDEQIVEIARDTASAIARVGHRPNSPTIAPGKSKRIEA